MPALSTTHLTKRFAGVAAVDRLSVTIPRGKVTGLVGPNGSGKTTLVNLLSGMFPYDAGMVHIDGVGLARIQPYDAPTYGVTRTFQQARLFEQMSVLDNILVVLTERNVFASLFERHTALHLKQAQEVLEMVGLWKKRDEHAEHLSYGQRKLLDIARACAMHADIILFDEPFAGLFPEMRAVVSDTIKHLRDQEKTVVLIEHDMEIIRDLSDHLIVLDAGTLLTEGTPDTVLRDEKVKEAYLGE